jgi:hypothetical protein
MPRNTANKGRQDEAAQLDGRRHRNDSFRGFQPQPGSSFGFDPGDADPPDALAVTETIKYGAKVVIQHSETNARLHSHKDKYPSGSKQQQVGPYCVPGDSLL